MIIIIIHVLLIISLYYENNYIYNDVEIVRLALVSSFYAVICLMITN